MDDSRIIKTEYSEVMQKSYIDYAMSVIIARALPDVRDGLKPVQRRTLYDMHELGIRYDRPYRKSARIVGDTMGKYHPHGDSSIYDALVVMTQDFKKGLPLVDGHGNFGNIEGDGAAAMRYTEARLQKVTQEAFLADLDKDVVDFIPNFDETEKEPSVLPVKIPNLLVNGSEGIAVGMATSIPPHNLREVIDAAKTKPYGFQAFYPGPGLGGHCIPLDPYYLTWKAREYGFHTTLIENSMVINDRQPEYCVERVMHLLNRHQKAVKGARILVLGVAYKQDINDYRESPAIAVIDELEKVGADVEFFDPWIKEYRHNGKEVRGLTCITPEQVAEFDLVMITTAHTNVDYAMILENARAVFDTKNVTKGMICKGDLEVL